MYADAAMFASARLKPAKTRLMTVEIDPSLIRLQTAPSQAQSLASKTTSSNTSSVMLTPVTTNGSASISSPTTAILSGPVGNDTILNRKADPAQGLYQTCSTLRERLKDVPDFEKKFLQNQTDELEDPVHQLWRVFQMGSSLCHLFNALGPQNPIDEEHTRPDLNTKNSCKAACFQFLMGIKNELKLEGDDAFMITHLWSEDTNGFVKVTKTVLKILDELQVRNPELKRSNRHTTERNSADKLPLDNRARVVQELVDTERKYVQDLENLQDYMRVLQASEAVSSDFIHNMFLNLNSLVDFQRRFLIRIETLYDMPPEQQRWGHIMVTHENSFDVYEPYCANFNAAQTLAAAEGPRLARVPHPVGQAGVAAFLIKPVQRICKYPLLLRDMAKYSNPEAQEELKEGIAAVERVNQKINEAIRKVDMSRVTEDLSQRVEDWKGHRLEHFGELLLNGQFTVIKGDGKGDVEREYHIYLFERILLCCKEIGISKGRNKTMSMGKKAVVQNANKKRTSLQLKGRIFMQNVTDIVSMAKNGNYTLQIFWKGDPGVEDFVIKHRNEETLNQWKTLLQKQVEICNQAENGVRNSGSNAKTSNTQFLWMQNSDPTDYVNKSEEELTEDDDDGDDGSDDVGPVYTPSYGTSRNGSSTSLRSRPTTNEGGPPQYPMVSGLPANPHPSTRSRYTHQSQNSTSHQPPLTLVTHTSAVSPGSQSPDRNATNMSYFSPTSETPMGSRASSSSGAFPFPRQPTPNNYHDEGRYAQAPGMTRTASREGAALVASQAVAGQRLQRPSLPGMSPGGSLQNRMRSASSPNIHHIPNSQQSTRSPGGIIPPVPMPPIPQTYQAYSGGPAVINRSQNGSPTSPLPGPARHASPGMQMQTHDFPRMNGSAKGLPQVKVRVNFNSDVFVIIVPYNIPFLTLMDRIERKVRICGSNGIAAAPSAANLKIRYQDEDGDFILMNSDDDVQMAFDSFSEPSSEGTIALFVTA